MTRNGSPAVVMVSADEWEEVQETHFWLSQPGQRERLAEAAADMAEGRVYGEADARATDQAARPAVSGYTPLLTAAALHGLAGLPPRTPGALLAFIYGPLVKNPQRRSHKLRTELAGYRSARRGDLRVLSSSTTRGAR